MHTLQHPSDAKQVKLLSVQEDSWGKLDVESRYLLVRNLFMNFKETPAHLGLFFMQVLCPFFTFWSLRLVANQAQQTASILLHSGFDEIVLLPLSFHLHMVSSISMPGQRFRPLPSLLQFYVKLKLAWPS